MQDSAAGELLGTRVGAGLLTVGGRPVAPSVDAAGEGSPPHATTAMARATRIEAVLALRRARGPVHAAGRSSPPRPSAASSSGPPPRADCDMQGRQPSG